MDNSLRACLHCSRCKIELLASVVEFLGKPGNPFVYSCVNQGFHSFDIRKGILEERQLHEKQKHERGGYRVSNDLSEMSMSSLLLHVENTFCLSETPSQVVFRFVGVAAIDGW